MTRAFTTTVLAAAFAMLAPSAFAQSADVPKPASPAQDRTADEAGQNQQAMRQMMREMMDEMLQEKTAKDRDPEADWRHRGPRLQDDEMSDRDTGRMKHGRRAGADMMQGAKMRITFAIMDTDGDGTLSRTEVQDFIGRIFNAVDEDGDESVDMQELQSFFRPGEDQDRR
ncbi:EF-hand domain-containing protein [Mesorhizobium sp. B2-3-14]|uniref:EF-hand domain-containing protein n=1 Tax=unclassified Mesorhizobium TaxID=325217 RepID=UPI0011287BA9|nr:MULTISPECIES: EF-hand domain-containing protein [unclassified Mesorhizobium]TPK73809.1 EF-hand domain-containing protein [Mesorhizobium sp. B2-4-18]TPL81393.1 EF-hand domain-containing protein [Mesorhizobium sp. B2-3-14]